MAGSEQYSSLYNIYFVPSATSIHDYTYSAFICSLNLLVTFKMRVLQQTLGFCYKMNNIYSI